MNETTLKRFADLIVEFGANVQEDQIVSVHCEPGNEFLVRALAESAYRHGAKFVDVTWFDPWVKRARIEFARDETLEFVPPWYGERALALGEHRCARIVLVAPFAPEIMSGLDPVRSGRDRLPSVKENGIIVNQQTTNWTIAPCPTSPWAELVYPDLEPAVGLAKLEENLLHVCRMDEPDPVAAWRKRADRLVEIAAGLTERRFDAIRYRGPGTDLTVGMLPSHQWMAARFATVDGIVHMPNIPTEEVFTTPDPQRVDGYVKSTKPLVLIGGTMVNGLEVEFKAGKVTKLSASEGEKTLATIVGQAETNGRLGEIALVDGESRIGGLDTVFYETLLDENAASHIALGNGFLFVIDDKSEQEKINQSDIHIDFMIGSNDVEAIGIKNGSEVPVLRDGRWMI